MLTQFCRIPPIKYRIFYRFPPFSAPDHAHISPLYLTKLLMHVPSHGSVFGKFSSFRSTLPQKTAFCSCEKSL